MKIYISGPITNNPTYKQDFQDAKDYLLKATAFDVINPVDFDVTDPKISWEGCMRRDIAALVDCDAICMIKNWEVSRGARLERHIASELEFEIYNLVDDELIMVEGPVENFI